MTSKVTISIIIPTYQAGAKLASSIESAIEQNREDLEIIVVDGLSTDNTVEIVHKYTSRCKIPMRMVSESDSGVYDAMNKGISLAEGIYVYFLGAGDRILPGALDLITDVIVNMNAPLVYGRIRLGNVSYGHGVSLVELSISNLPHQAVFYRRELFKEVGLFNLRYPVLADWDLNIRWFAKFRYQCKYVCSDIAQYEGGGLSSEMVDPQFFADRPKLILKYFGVKTFIHYGIRRFWTAVSFRLRLLKGAGSRICIGA